MLSLTNDQRTFNRLYETEMPRVFRYICYLVDSGERARDLTADVFQEAVLDWPRVRRQLHSPRAWLFSLAVQRLSAHLQGQAIPPEPERELVPAPAADAEESAFERPAELDLLFANLSRLSEQERTILALHFAGELGHREIGQVLGLDEKEAAIALLRSLRRLRQVYGGGDDG